MTTWGMRFACWIPKATDTHSEYVIYLLVFDYNNGCTNVPQCYVIRTLPVLSLIRTVHRYKTSACKHYCTPFTVHYQSLLTLTTHIISTTTLLLSEDSLWYLAFREGGGGWGGGALVKIVPKMET